MGPVEQQISSTSPKGVVSIAAIVEGVRFILK